METQAFEFPMLFLLIHFSIYLVGYFIVFRKWSPETRPEASSCFMSLFHGTPAAVVATAAILSARSSNLAAANTRFQNLVLDYSTAYFVADLVHLAVFFGGADDAMFLTHHLATLFVLVTCRDVAAHGAVAVLALLALGEATNAFLDAWMLARARRSEAPRAARVCDALTVPFCCLYSVIRGVFGPCVVFRMVVVYSRGGGEGVIATWVWVSWVVVVSFAIVGSLVWVSFLCVEVYRERTKKFEEKIQS
ncbi:TLC domain-containing protein At5g14285 [Cajanus cajan]|uniref:TLC domain-containing protein n=1 Tax=Cajanus cajan TaxID=3821 RepID=A0A151SFR2_CAJCA|nr:TLC domain-containing protein At5g14285 [Cajanus cajan]KYP53670.1 hypothetical protein KK1_024244 [Cajanus cajan]